MQFKDVVGQEDLKKKIIYLIQQGKMPHAVMLLGNDGSGGLPMALAMAQYIQCANKTDVDSCGDCTSCAMLSKMQHPDVHFSFPTAKLNPQKIPVSNDYIVEYREFVLAHPYGSDKDWLDYLETEKQGNITALECREIIQKLQLRTFMSEYKVFIMWRPEYLGSEGNILLKFIEEPTAKTILIFVATQLEKVLLTIQSRTQLFNLSKLKNNEIQEALIKHQVEPSKALQIANLANGNYHYALQLINDQDDDMLGYLKQFLNGIYANKGLEIVVFVNQIASDNKETQKKFIMYFVNLLENLVRYRQVGKAHVSLLEAEYKILDTLIAKKMSDYQVDKVATLLEECIYQIERNANAKILFHSLSLQIQQLLLFKKAVA
jgi:DNA polymerase-3 subunit delta'